MTPEYYVLIVGYIFGFYMSWNIGANDVANSMASQGLWQAVIRDNIHPGLSQPVTIEHWVPQLYLVLLAYPQGSL